jgi:hypothetical protein
MLNINKISMIKSLGMDLGDFISSWAVTLGSHGCLGSRRGLVQDGFNILRVIVVWFKTRAFSLVERK